MRERVFTEIGFGNGSFLSTEIEGRKKEYRVGKFVKPKKIDGVYLRVWILKRVFILSSCDGFKFGKKSRIDFKFLFGVQGIGV
ncbi:DUF3977 family protein [archaeon]|nr:DUF3977 family protein [archaeon]